MPNPSGLWHYEYTMTTSCLDEFDEHGNQGMCQYDCLDNTNILLMT